MITNVREAGVTGGNFPLLSSTVHHVTPYKYKALLSRSIIVLRIFNFAANDGTRSPCKRRKTKEEGESCTGTNCNTDGIICCIIVFVE